PVGNLNTKEPILKESWSHIVATCDIKKGEQRIYVNGILKAEQIGLKPVVVMNENPLRIGASSTGGACLKGKIDEVKIYNRVLDEEEIKKDYKDVPR
ncbi:LamG domain-containing protein, partial [bacterium]|nr:LamG domain-containing protein [bacterium]